MSPLAALLINWVLTALWPLIGKSGTERFTGVLFAQAGMVVGFLALAPWLARKGRWRRIVSPELLGPFLMMGLFGSALTSYFFLTALEYTTPANAAIMAQVEVLYSALLSAWLLKERIPAVQVAGSALVVLGTGLILAHDLGSPRWKGDLMILLTPWMFQISHIYAKRLPADLDAVAISGGRVLYGMLTLLPFTVWSLFHAPRWGYDAQGAALIAFQGVAMNALNLILWYMAIRRMDLAKATAIMLSYPALTVIISWGLGTETLGAVQLAGLAVTLGGAYMVSILVLRGGKELPPATGIS